MRISLIGPLMVLGLVSLAPSTARAYSGNFSGTRYVHCVCKFGYPNNPLCQPATACAAEGGWCARRCVQPPGDAN